MSAECPREKYKQNKSTIDALLDNKIQISEMQTRYQTQDPDDQEKFNRISELVLGLYELHSNIPDDELKYVALNNQIKNMSDFLENNELLKDAQKIKGLLQTLKIDADTTKKELCASYTRILADSRELDDLVGLHYFS